jgi:hypothetical protein
MSAYRGRTGPNFSEYLNNLNTLASPYEEDQFTESLELNQELAMFTNTDFTHFDIPTLGDDNSFDFQVNNEKPEEIKFEELLSGTDQTQTFNSPVEGPQYYANYNPPIQPAPAQGFPPSETQGGRAAGPASGAKRKAEVVQTPEVSPEEGSRLAAEEDKRRRNTAASARFRVKKKQREQALERSVKDINDRNTKLEAKVSQLEMENKWLKDLITEKNAIQSREEIDAAFQKFKRESEEREEAALERASVLGAE